MKSNYSVFKYFLLVGAMLFSFVGFSQRIMEDLDRGLIAMRTGNNSVLVSWRITGDEYRQDATYNLYRGTTIIASDLTVSNFVDEISTDESYSVAAIIDGVEHEQSATASVRGWEYFDIPVQPIDGTFNNHNINDASVGDLDGDGEYEIVVKRLANNEDPSSSHYHHLQAYELDGTFMWDINLGPNLLHNQEVNFLVYDLDNDGKAEIATRTSDGMIDGLGNNIGDRDADGQVNYRSTAVQNTFWFRVDGPDYISIFDGETGGEIAWDMYIDREPIDQWGLVGQNLSQLGHRATKCMWAVAYTDGVHPSFVISRGIYHRIKLEAWHFRDGKLTQEWAWDSDPNDSPSAYTAQGNHNLAAGDLDGDGRDEITYGGMAIDENGMGLYTTNFGHGDAAHLADINPNVPGLEYFSCQEHANGTSIPGISIRNAADGTIYWKNPSSGDIGRCMAGDIDSEFYGMEVWGSDGSGLRSCTGELISQNIPTGVGGGVSYNFGIWWDGDVQREIYDRDIIAKWNSNTKSTDRLLTFWRIADATYNNGSKANPCLMADVLGDWREEVILRDGASTKMIVFVSPYSTDQRMYTLMHDPNYRSAIAWQNNTYNQPPNLGFYFGGGMDTPPVPDMRTYKSCLNDLRFVPYGNYNGLELIQNDLLDDITDLDLQRGTSMLLFEEDNFGGGAQIIRGTGNCYAITQPSSPYLSAIISRDIFVEDLEYTIKTKTNGQLLTVGSGAGEIISISEQDNELFQTWRFERTANNEYAVVANHSDLLIRPELDLYWVQDDSQDPVTDDQKYEIVMDEQDPRFFAVKNKANGKCFEVDPENGTLLCKECDASSELQLFYEDVYKEVEKVILGNSPSGFNLYPNPVEDVLTFTGAEVKQVHVYNEGGQLILSAKNLKNNQISLTSIKAGIYLVKTETNKGQFESKIIKH